MRTRSAPRRTTVAVVLLAALSGTSTVVADDEFTLYELLDPDSNTFAITFDVTTSRAGQSVYLNGVRPGSEVLDERVIDRASGRDLPWELIDGATAKARGLRPERTPDDAQFIAVALPHPVPDNGEIRLRIIKTYVDANSYFAEGDRVVFERSLGVRANAVVLPAGYELIESSVPVIVSTLDDGRVKVSTLNDRRDALGVRLVGRRLPMAGETGS